MLLSMAKNANLGAAKNAKNDEFYTQYADIQKEVNAYIEYNPDVFRGKTILLPCDDPEWSNFTKFFAQNFEFFGLKKLISTSYAIESKKYKTDWQPTLFETENPLYNVEKSRIKGKIFTLTHDTNANGRIDIDDLQWSYLEGDGDFRSAEVTALRDEADIIITNPPFSLFREFLAWIMEGGKQFLIIGNINAISYKEVFPLIRDNQMWMGSSYFNGGAAYFIGSKDFYDPKLMSSEKHAYIQEDKLYWRVNGVRWFTNLDHGRRHQPLQLMTMEDNIRFNKKMKEQAAYICYENYDAIDVPYTELIPSDYQGAMGVPISFLDKYCPEQFEIIGHPHGDYGLELGLKPFPRELKKLNKGLRDGDLYYMKDGKPELPYRRILIRKKQ